MIPRIFFLIVPLAMQLGSRPAAAQNVVSVPIPPVTPLSLSFDGDIVWRLDESYRLLSRNRTSAQAGVSASLDLRRLAGGTLATGLGFHASELDGNWGGGGNEATLGSQTLSASALLRWTVRPWLEPHLRVAADGTWSKLSLELGDGKVLDGRAWSPGGSAGAGFRLRTRSTSPLRAGGRWGLAAALMVEAGFHLGRALDFDLARRRPDDDRLAGEQTPGPTVPVGTLGRSHPYLRISFALLL